MTYKAEQQTSLSQESEPIAVDAKREFRNDIPNLDSGWRAIKFITMAVLVYVVCCCIDKRMFSVVLDVCERPTDLLWHVCLGTRIVFWVS